MGDVSDIPLKSRSNAQTLQPWDDDSDFWEDPATLHAIDELTIAEIKEAADAAQHEKSERTGPLPTGPLLDNERRSGGKSTSSPSSSKTITATIFRPPQSPQSQGILHASCPEVT